MIKDCTKCVKADTSDLCYEDARCWCDNLEIYIFNPEPFYCSDFRPVEEAGDV